MAEIAEVGPRLGVRPTCEALGVAPATYYRHQRGKEPPKVIIRYLFAMCNDVAEVRCAAGLPGFPKCR